MSRVEVVSLFPKPLGIYRWEKEPHVELRSLLQELTAKRDAEHNTISPDIVHFWNNSKESLLDIDHPVVRKFEKFLSESYVDFTQDVYNWDMTKDHLITECWVNITRKGGYQFKHSHGNSFVSGTYYLNFPSGAQGLTVQSPAIEKNNPYLRTNPREQNMYNSETLTIMPDEGILYLWSSELTHETLILKEDVTRVSISMNFVPSELDNGIYSIKLSK